jgi:hypothetical protein
MMDFDLFFVRGTLVIVQWHGGFLRNYFLMGRSHGPKIDGLENTRLVHHQQESGEPVGVASTEQN